MIQKLFAYCQGRHTFFAFFFAITGTALQWFHRLDPVYVAYVTSLMGMVLGHSIQENHFNVSTTVDSTTIKKDGGDKEGTNVCPK